MTSNGTYCAEDLADINTPLLYDYWYVAALASEISRDLMERTILDRSLIMYRDEDGNAVILQNRCAHRSFPLAKSNLEQGGIRCKYHGIKYNHDGEITDVPCQSKCPKSGIKKYITHEIGPVVWVWMGDNDKATIDDIPELPVHDMDKWVHVVGKYNHMEGSYILLHENLCDLSHLPFLHASTFKMPEAYTSTAIEVEKSGDRVTFYRKMTGWEELKPFFHPNLDFSGQDFIYKSGGEYITPATNKGYGLIIPLDEDGNEQPEVGHYISHYLTPETQSSCHYYWFLARNYQLDDATYSGAQGKMIQDGFDEDCTAIKLLQEMFDKDGHDYKEIGIQADKPGVIMRKIIKGLVD
ncbi:MAG: Rieske 2Fe-2S domain-containing protein [Kordiimonadaceae bacterium]|nr:Rieske 2Fe-2S domain-containing protein [Kordiimonadaceae bacterium]